MAVPGPERQIEAAIVEGERRLRDLASPEPPVGLELARRGALEAEDRLFSIADANRVRICSPPRAPAPR
jgi:hypothetical protein